MAGPGPNPGGIANVQDWITESEYRSKIKVFDVECDNGRGSGYACHSVGEFLSTVDKNYAAAAEVFRQNCDGKNKYAASCLRLGMFEIKGVDGCAQNDLNAARHFKKGCQEGHPVGCYLYGSMLLEGRTLRQDVPQSMEYFEKGCEGNDYRSCWFLGAAYLAGRHGKPRDPAAAQPYLETACNVNFTQACHALAVMYGKGDVGVPADAAKAKFYKEKVLSIEGLDENGNQPTEPQQQPKLKSMWPTWTNKKA